MLVFRCRDQWNGKTVRMIFARRFTDRSSVMNCFMSSGNVGDIKVHKLVLQRIELPAAGSGTKWDTPLRPHTRSNIPSAPA